MPVHHTDTGNPSPLLLRLPLPFVKVASPPRVQNWQGKLFWLATPLFGIWACNPRNLSALNPPPFPLKMGVCPSHTQKLHRQSGQGSTWLESGPAIRTAKALTESLKVAEKNSTWQAGDCCRTALIMRMESDANPSCCKPQWKYNEYFFNYLLLSIYLFPGANVPLAYSAKEQAAFCNLIPIE